MSEPLGVEDRARLRALVNAIMPSSTLSESIIALLDEVDRLTEALEAAERAHEACAETEDDAYAQAVGTLINTPIAAEARATLHWKDRAERAEADLADERRRHAERVERLAGHEWSGGYFCACGHELNSPRGYLAHLRALLCQNAAMPPVEYVENLPHLLSDTTTGADECTCELGSRCSSPDCRSHFVRRTNE